MFLALAGYVLVRRFAGASADRLAAGLAVFGLTCNLLAQHIVNHLNRIPQDFLSVAQMLAA